MKNNLKCYLFKLNQAILYLIQNIATYFICIIISEHFIKSCSSIALQVCIPLSNNQLKGVQNNSFNVLHNDDAREVKDNYLKNVVRLHTYLIHNANKVLFLNNCILNSLFILNALAMPLNSPNICSFLFLAPSNSIYIQNSVY